MRGIILSINISETSFTALADVSETIRFLLEKKIQEKFKDITVILDSPKKIEDDDKTNSNLISVYLYRISENSAMKNHPALQIDKDKSKPSPLGLDLHYLITAYGIDETNKLAFLGRAMQILYDHPVLQGTALRDANIIKLVSPPSEINLVKDTDNLVGSSKQLRISHDPLNQETITQIWQALEVSMRLSAFYIVTPAEIESTLETTGKRIIERELRKKQEN